jgi:hypothetical protein
MASRKNIWTGFVSSPRISSGSGLAQRRRRAVKTKITRKRNKPRIVKDSVGWRARKMAPRSRAGGGMNLKWRKRQFAAQRWITAPARRAA